MEELLLIANDHDLDVTEDDIEKIDENGTTYLIINIATEINGTGYNPLTWPDVVPVESVMKTLEPKEKETRFYIVSKDLEVTKEFIESGEMKNFSRIIGISINNPELYFTNFEDAEKYLNSVINENFTADYKISKVEL